MSTIQSGVGITPSAPWMRSRRASSRVDVKSSHLSYADCWDGSRRLDGLEPLEERDRPTD